MSDEDQFGPRSKAYKALTPGEKREKAKERARADLEKIKREARAARKPLKDVKGKIKPPKTPRDTGTVMTSDEVDNLDSAGS